jgi:hypothetical protein
MRTYITCRFQRVVTYQTRTVHLTIVWNRRLVCSILLSLPTLRPSDSTTLRRKSYVKGRLQPCSGEIERWKFQT